MKKILLFLLPVVLSILCFSLFTLWLSHDSIGQGALQVTANPQSSVYLNGKLIGKTPLCKCDPKTMIATGDYDIKLIPLDPKLSGITFNQKITITKSVLTVVDQTFGTGATGQGSVISLLQTDNKTSASLSVVSFPQGATVSLDDNEIGQTPVKLSSLTESDHDISISKIGYKTKNIKIHAVDGYTLSVVSFLGIDPDAASASASAQFQPVASPSAAVASQKIVILSTPTGFLRVHKDADINSTEIAQVKPDEQYALISEQQGWFQIKLLDGTLGWISATYAKKL